MVTAEKMPGLADTKPSNSAEVDGVHLDHSPMEKSKKNYLYFEGHFGDSTKQHMRMVSFSNA